MTDNIQSADWRGLIVNQLRELILASDPAMIEETKWVKPTNPAGVPTFSCDGLIATVETYKDKVKVTFARGAALADPTGLFNASLDAGTRRALDIPAGVEVDSDAFSALIKAAVTFNRAK